MPNNEKRFKERARFARRSLTGYGDINRKNSWYFNVLLKKYGTEEKALQSIKESRIRCDVKYYGKSK